MMRECMTVTGREGEGEGGRERDTDTDFIDIRP